MFRNKSDTNAPHLTSQSRITNRASSASPYVAPYEESSLGALSGKEVSPHVADELNGPGRGQRLGPLSLTGSEEHLLPPATCAVSGVNYKGEKAVSCSLDFFFFSFNFKNVVLTRVGCVCSSLAGLMEFFFFLRVISKNVWANVRMPLDCGSSSERGRVERV